MEKAEILDGLLQKVQRSHRCAEIGNARVIHPTEFGSYCQA
jgi:hypothetical protein